MRTSMMIGGQQDSVARFFHEISNRAVLQRVHFLAYQMTITGSVANIIVVERARKEAAVTFLDYFRIDLPITFLTLLFDGLWLSWVR